MMMDLPQESCTLLTLFGEFQTTIVLKVVRRYSWTEELLREEKLPSWVRKDNFVNDTLLIALPSDQYYDD